MRKTQQQTKTQEQQTQTGEDLLKSLLDKPHVPQTVTVTIEADKPEIKRVVKVWCDRKGSGKWVLELDDGTAHKTSNAVIHAATFSCKKIGTDNYGCGISDIYRGYATGTWNPLEKALAKGKRLEFDVYSGKFYHETPSGIYTELNNVGLLMLLDGCSARFSELNPKL